MARPFRIEFEDAIYHITARGNRRERIFASDADRQRFLETLVRSLARYQVELYAYVLLPNHFHLLAKTKRPNLSRWMHWLMVTYTVFFNRRHGKVGHLFQGRYKSLLVEGGSYLLGVSRYLHLNPVRERVLGAGDPKERRERLRDYPWSSYRGYASVGKQAGFVTEELVLEEMDARGTRESKLRYRRFVEEGLVREIENPLEAAQWQAVLGSEGFLQRVKDKMQPHREKRREVKALRQGTSGLDPLAIIDRVAAQYHVSAERLLRGREYGLQARGIAMWCVWQLCELTLREIGSIFGGMDYAAVAQRIRRIEHDQPMQKTLKKVLQQCQNT
jgi:REP element-mobilizing transposase RayT